MRVREIVIGIGIVIVIVTVTVIVIASTSRRRAGAGRGYTANVRTKILDFRGLLIQSRNILQASTSRRPRAPAEEIISCKCSACLTKYFLQLFLTQRYIISYTATPASTSRRRRGAAEGRELAN